MPGDVLRRAAIFTALIAVIWVMTGCGGTELGSTSATTA